MHTDTERAAIERVTRSRTTDTGLRRRLFASPSDKIRDQTLWCVARLILALKKRGGFTGWYAQQEFHTIYRDVSSDGDVA